MDGPDRDIVAHYGGTGLYDRILALLAEAGIARDRVTTEHLKAVDEFHIGGAESTVALLDQLGIGPATRILDIGSGIGGPARLMAERYGAKVTGIDLTPEFVEAARRLTATVGLSAEFVVGSALALPFEPLSFDLATLIHVGMNLPDKRGAFSEVARVLAPGGTFAVFDVMLFGAHPAFPLPWASGPETSFLAPPEVYLEAARDSGLLLVARRDRGEAARDYFARIQAALAAGQRPPVGLPLLMAEAHTKIANMMAAVEAGDIQPVEMIFSKPAAG